MNYVLKNERDIFWMSYSVNEDFRIRVAIGAVMLGATEEEEHRIERSLRPLKLLSAAITGIPVDWTKFNVDDDMIPIMKIWHEVRSNSKKE